jgi:hypothetical protein
MNFWQKAFPHVVVILGFIILSLTYMSPVFEGKQLMQNDMLQAQGAAQELSEHYKQTGKRAFWSNNMFSGMPAFMVAMDYPMSLPTQLARVIVYALPTPANALFMYMLGFYLMAVLFGFSAWQAGVGSLLYAMGAYNVINIETGHTSKVFALAFAAPLMGAVYYAYNKNWWLGSALAGLFAAFELYANHPQITYYVFLTLVLFVGYQTVQCFLKKATWKQFGLATAGLAVVALLALGSHASRVWTTYEYTGQTIRGKSELKTNKESTSGAIDRDYAFAWSYGIAESFTFIIPNFYGSGTGAGREVGKDSKSAKVLGSLGIAPEQAQDLPYYWGAQPFTSGPAYLGIVVCLLAFLGVLISTNPLRWWLFSTAFLLITIAWGKNFFFNDILFQYLPLFNKFRAHTMTLSVLQIFVVALAMLGLQALFAKDANLLKMRRSLYISAGTIGGLCLVFALFGGFFQDYASVGTAAMSTEGGKIKQVGNDEAFLNQLAGSFKDNPDAPKRILRAVREDRANMQSGDAWRSVAFVLVATGVLWVFMAGYFTWEYALAIVGLVALIDLWAVDRRYLNNDNFKSKSDYESTFSLSESENKISEDNSRHRVANFNRNTFNDAVTSYNFASVGGYHGAKLRRYQDVIDKHFSNNTPAMYDMLNVKYVLTANEAGEAKAQKNPNACGNAWFVGDYEVVANADAEINALTSLRPMEKAIIDKRFEKQVANVKKAQESTGKITLTKTPSPDELIYETNNATAQIAVFSEIYYVQAGKIYWQAYIDGKEVPHFRANYILRGLVVPAGKHTIKFKFQVPIYHTGETISLLFSLLLLSVLAGAGFMYYRQVTQKT